MFWFLGPVLYNLYAVCYHSGTVNMGHYTACCRDEDGWWYYNDSRWGLYETYTFQFKFNTHPGLLMAYFKTCVFFFLLQCAKSPREPAPVKSGLCFVLPVWEQWHETLRCWEIFFHITGHGLQPQRAFCAPVFLYKTDTLLAKSFSNIILSRLAVTLK